MTQSMTPIEVLVCIKCRREGIDPDAETRPGTKLLNALEGANPPASVQVKAVECLSNCTHGCSVALRGPGRWSYVYGNLDENLAEIVLEGAQKYQSTADGLVPWRERPEHFRKNCIARIPPLEA